MAISADETMSVMVNEEDHLRMQRLASGLQLDAVLRRREPGGRRVERQLDYAFSKRWGYLTACPTNVGTGIRFSVMMHLPALKITSEIERVRRVGQATCTSRCAATTARDRRPPATSTRSATR